MPILYHVEKTCENNLKKIMDAPSVIKRNKDDIAAFYQRLTAESVSPFRRKQYLYILTKILALNKKAFRDYTDADFTKVLSYFETHKMKNGKPYSEHVKKEGKVTIKKFWKFLLGSEFNPMRFAWMRSAISRRKIVRLQPEDMITYTEMSAILKAASPMMQALFSAAFETGARPSELLSLRYMDIVVVSEGGQQYAKLNIRESKSEPRTVPVVRLFGFLKAWLDLHPLKKPESPLFPSSYRGMMSGNFMTVEGYNKALKQCAKEAGIKKQKITPYVLRHSAISRMVSEGWGETIIKQISGHSLNSKQFDVYVHLASKQKEEYALHKALEAEGKAIAENEELPYTLCNACKGRNPITNNFCQQCSRPISVTAINQEEIKKQSKMEELENRMGELEEFVKLLPQLRKMAKTA